MMKDRLDHWKADMRYASSFLHPFSVGEEDSVAIQHFQHMQLAANAVTLSVVLSSLRQSVPVDVKGKAAGLGL